MQRDLSRLDTPLARAALVLLPLVLLALPFALEGHDRAQAPRAAGSGRAAAEGAAVAPESARVRALLELHDDGQALLYGRDEPGTEVAVFANNVECARDVVDEEGWWVVTVPAEAPCAPQTGQLLWIARDGEYLARAQVWSPGLRSVGEGIRVDAPPGIAQEGASPPATSPTN